MSFEALARVTDVEDAVPSSSALLLLYILASYAGPDGTCFPSQATLGKRAKLGERAVRDNLKLLVDCGIIEVEARARADGTRATSQIRLTYYKPEENRKSGPSQRRLSPVAQERSQRRSAPVVRHRQIPPVDAEASQRQNSPVDHRQISPPPPAINAGPTTFEPITEPEESADALSERESEGARLFEDVITAFAAADPHTVARPLDEAAWRKAAERIEPERLAGAVQRYLADCAQRQKRPFSLAKWLQLQKWEPWLSSSGTDEKPALAAWPGPPEVRAALVAAKGEDFARAYLDPATWDGARRAVLARTHMASQRLEYAAAPLREAGVSLILVRERAG